MAVTKIELKANTPKGALVYLKRRVIALDTATQAELQLLAELKHPYVKTV